jgi:hypothetical protein
VRSDHPAECGRSDPDDDADGHVADPCSHLAVFLASVGLEQPRGGGRVGPDRGGSQEPVDQPRTNVTRLDSSRLITDHQHRDWRGDDEILSDPLEQQPARAAFVVIATDDQVGSVMVNVREQRPNGCVAFDDLVLDIDPGAFGSVLDLIERVLEVAVGGVSGLGAVGGRLGMSRRVRNRDGYEFGLVAAGDVDGDIKGTQRDLRAVPGKEDSLKRQRRMGTRDRATIKATSM